MAKTPKRLAGPALLTNSSATKYTVPAGTKTIIRALHLQNPSASPVTFTLSIGADAAGVRLYDSYSIPAAAAGVTDNVRVIFVYWVLEATEIIAAHAGTNNIMTLTIFGDELTLG